MNKTLKSAFDKLQNWTTFSNHYQLDPKLGYLIHPHHQITSFNYTLMHEQTQGFTQLSSQQIIQKIYNFPNIELREERTFKDMMVLHDMASLIVSVYNAHSRKLGYKDQDIVIPHNLAEPLSISSCMLEIKMGMTANIAYMWTPLNNSFQQDEEEFGYKDFKLKCPSTQEEYHQFLFFGASVIASFYLAKMNRMIYEINSIINQDPAELQSIKLRLGICRNYWKKIIEQNNRLLKELDPKIFYYSIRPYLHGFTRIKLKAANKGEDVIVSSSGGTGGNDPSFQIFQQGFGLRFEGHYRQQQLSLQTGMASNHRKLIQYYESCSLLREFCKGNKQLKNEYNSVLREYVVFLMIHGQFISNFIMRNMMEEVERGMSRAQSSVGTAGLGLQAIIDRYRVIEKQLL